MTIDDVQARIDRLDELAKGLTKEQAIVRAAEDPMLSLERRAYVVAIADALFGVEAGRAVLAAALQRIRRETAQAQERKAAG
jgi:hypothetical protein